MMDKDENPPAPRMLGMPLKWGRRAFVLSLVVNFLVIGLFVGAAVRFGDGRGYGPGWMAARHVIGHIEDDDRRAAAKARLEARRAEMRASRDDRGRVWTEMANLVAEPTLNSEAIRTALTDFEAIRALSRSAAHEALLEIISKMTPAERAELSEDMLRLANKWSSRRRD